MTVTREEIAAFADGQLDRAREAEVAALVAADPALAEQVRGHRALRERLAGHFAPILDAPLPERLTAPLTERPEVIDLAAAREKRERARVLPRWSWLAGPALAASLALAVFLPRGGSDYADGALASALDTQLVAAQEAGAPNRILLSFRDEGGAFCRAFAGEAQSGIACREDEGWRLRMTAPGAPAQQTDYRMADNPSAEVLERAQAMAAGDALDAEEERAAQARGWR
jgi:hypothetical protein